MSGIFLLLGSNQGDRHHHLQEACRLLSGEEIRVIRSSSVYETAPWGKRNQDWFLNVAVEIETNLLPAQLLTACQRVEQLMGRVRIEKWGERIIDIDILYYNGEHHTSETLEIPHPGIPSRRFTLMPLVEMAPDLFHPTLGKTQQQLLDLVEDPLEVVRTDHELAL